MSRGRRRALWTVGSLAALLLMVFAWAYFTLESEWFFDKVRRAMITTVETATGGRVEIGGFRFDRGHFTAGWGVRPARTEPPAPRCPRVLGQGGPGDLAHQAERRHPVARSPSRACTS